MKSDLIDKIAIFLLKEGFTVKTLTRSCFDLLARKKDRIMLIKALEDANSVMQNYVDEMNRVSDYIGAVPLIIAEKAGDPLQENVLYSRFGMFTLNFHTFQNCIHNKFPFIKRTQAGLTASILGEKLRKVREEMGFSLNMLSKKVGVSSRMISKYEDGSAEITFAKAQKLHDVFGNKVFHEINIFSRNNQSEDAHKTSISKKYVQLGFDASDTKNTPFDIIAKKDGELILTEVGDKARPDLTSLSRLLDADKLVIYKKKKPKDVAAITKEEFLEFEKAQSLLKFLKENS